MESAEVGSSRCGLRKGGILRSNRLMEMARKSRLIIAVLSCSTICVASQLNDRKASGGPDAALSSVTVAGPRFS